MRNYTWKIIVGLAVQVGFLYAAAPDPEDIEGRLYESTTRDRKSHKAEIKPNI